MQFHPLWLFCCAFRNWHTPFSGKLARVTLSDPKIYCNWVRITPLNISVDDDTVDVVGMPKTAVWRIVGDEPEGDRHFTIYIGKNHEGLLRLDLTDTSSAIMLARAGR